MRQIYFNTSKDELRSKPIRDVKASQGIVASTQSGATGDDYYKVTQVSYDSDLISKGITSSMPIVLSTIPFKKLTDVDNAESEILNIQRNLSTITLSNVSDIINKMSGSSLSDEEILTFNDTSQYKDFNSVVGKITAAYQAKAAYMTHLESLYYLETDSDFNNSYGSGTFPELIPTVSVTEHDVKKQWVESELKMSIRGYNITQLMQILRNAFARKKFGKNITIDYTGVDSMTLAPVTSTQYESAKDKFFSGLYSGESNESFDSLASIVDTLIVADSKDLTYTKNGIDPNIVFNELVGNIVNFDRKSRLSARFNAGIYSGLLDIVDNGTSVLCIDTNVENQADLKRYTSADEYFLGKPLNTDRELLIQRSEEFSTISKNIEDNVKEKIDVLIGEKNQNGSLGQDLESWAGFLSQMNAMMESSFFTNDNSTSALRFSFLLKGLTGSLFKIIKIMMLRDRLRNPLDYVISSERDDFLSMVNDELENAINDYLKDFEAFEGDFESFNSSLGRTFRSGNTFTGFYRFSSRYGPGVPGDIKRDLINPDGHQWDNFFTAAANVERSSNKIISNLSKTSWDKSSSLSAKIGASKGFLTLNRDQRAFLYLVKWLSIVVNTPFDIKIDPYVPPEDQEQEDDNNSEYFGTYDYYVASFSYSSELYDDLKKSLSLTIPIESSPNVLSNFVRYSFPITQTLLQDTQVFYDSVDLVYRYIMQTNTLLATASKIAHDYQTTFGEKLSNNYTFNSVQALNRQARYAPRQSTDFKYFSKDMYKETTTLNGFMRFIQDDPEIPTDEDSFIVVCGIPYGMLDRLGAFNQNKITYIEVSLLIRTINATQDDDIIIKKRYPATGFIEHQALKYTPTINSSGDSVLAATQLFELNTNSNFSPNDQFSIESKRNELESVSLLNYLELFLGIKFDGYVTVQNDLGDLDTQQMKDIKVKFVNEVRSYRFSDLVQSRYAAAGLNSIQFSRNTIISRSLSGPIFDKIVAIPVDANLLRKNRSGYLVDVLVSLESVSTDREITPPPERSRSISNRDFSSQLENATNRVSVTEIAAAFQPNVFGAR